MGLKGGIKWIIKLKKWCLVIFHTKAPTWDRHCLREKKTLQRLRSFIWNPSLLNVRLEKKKKKKNVRLEVLFPIFMLNCDSLGDYCCSSFILFLCQHVEKECLWELLNFTQRKLFHVPRKKTIIHLKGYKVFFISSIFSPIFKISVRLRLNISNVFKTLLGLGFWKQIIQWSLTY